MWLFLAGSPLKNEHLFTSPLVGEVGSKSRVRGISEAALMLKRFQKSHGFTVLRLWNNDVFSNLEGVLEMLLSTPHPPLCGDLSHKGLC